MTARFVPGSGLDEILAEAAEPGLVEVAAKIKQTAERSAPVATGDYRRRFRVFEDRRGVGVLTVDPAGHIIEWGSEDTAPHGTLRAAAAEHGKFEPK